MSKTGPRLLLALALVTMLPAFAGPALAVERVEKTLTHEEAVARGGSLGLENLLGSVTVRGGGTPGKVLVEALVVAEAKTPEEARALADAIHLSRRRSGKPVLVHVAFPVERYTAFRLPRQEGQKVLSKWLAPLLGRNSVAAVYDGRAVQLGRSKGAVALAVHLKVTLPNDIHSSIRQFMGSVQCTLVRGRLELENVEGKMVVSRIYGGLRARTGGGDVSVLTAKGEQVFLHTGSGNMELIDVNVDEVLLQTGSGHIKGEALTVGHLAVQATAGNVDLDDLDSRTFQITTGSGNVNLGTRLQRTRKASIQSASGDVILRVGNIAPFDLQFETDSGSVKAKGLSLEAAQEGGSVPRLRRGTGGVDLRVTTGSGEVILRAQ